MCIYNYGVLGVQGVSICCIRSPGCIYNYIKSESRVYLYGVSRVQGISIWCIRSPRCVSIIMVY